ncbi:hypothetical protein EVAR_54994_1 [Eumeta japonica]|uniref:Uncharacterized protein n=1 Tax=Eumeta variegata TaxID=151549 RepID=A0A4C1Z5Q3_EUMVA|nr:hypothetical protein EVAR_54994_1 [Eumeta japonica]
MPILLYFFQNGIDFIRNRSTRARFILTSKLRTWKRSNQFHDTLTDTALQRGESPASLAPSHVRPIDARPRPCPFACSRPHYAFLKISFGSRLNGARRSENSICQLSIAKLHEHSACVKKIFEHGRISCEVVRGISVSGCKAFDTLIYGYGSLRMC